MLITSFFFFSLFLCNNEIKDRNKGKAFASFLEIMKFVLKYHNGWVI